MSHAAGPVGQAERIASLDVLRGVAVCGILLMNIPMMGMMWEGARPPAPARPTVDWIAYVIQSVGFEGSMRGLFTLLFGAGTLIMLRRAEDASAPAAQAYLTRCFALMLLGIANFALFMWPGEILFNYGICGLALILFRKADVRVLMTGAAAILVTLTIAAGHQTGGMAGRIQAGQEAAAAQAAGRPLSEEQKEALEAHGKISAMARPTPEMIAKEREQRTAFPAVLSWSTERWVEFNLKGIALIFLAESLAVMMLGMALYRLGVLSGERSVRFYALLAAAGYGVGLAVRGYVASVQWRHGYAPSPEGVLLYGWTYELGRLPTTLGLTGLVLLLFKLGALRWLEAGLTAIGRLALTNYMGQSIITSVLFYVFGLWGRLGFAQLMGVAALIWIAQGVFSVLWLRRWQMGPFEGLLRSVTYGRWTPLGRVKPDRAMAAPAE